MKIFPILMAILLLGGCSTAYHSHMASALPGPAAGRVTHELVTALSHTEEVRPAGRALCVAPAAGNHPFEHSLRANLRLAGYALVQQKSGAAPDGSPCLIFLGEERLDPETTAKAGLYCLCLGSRSICREYRLPGMEPISSLSIAGFDYQAPLPPGSAPAEGADPESERPDSGSATVISRTETLVFGRGSLALSAANEAQIVALAEQGRTEGWVRVRITGLSIHPRLGGNRELARQRAAIVADMLGRYGPSGVPIETEFDVEKDVSGQGLTRGVVIQIFGRG